MDDASILRAFERLAESAASPFLRPLRRDFDYRVLLARLPQPSSTATNGSAQAVNIQGSGVAGVGALLRPQHEPSNPPGGAGGSGSLRPQPPDVNIQGSDVAGAGALLRPQHEPSNSPDGTGGSGSLRPQPPDAVVATRTTHPAAFRLLDMLREPLRLDLDFEVRVAPMDQWLLTLIPPSSKDRRRFVDAGPACLVMSTAVVTRLWEPATLFELGRALGRILIRGPGDVSGSPSTDRSDEGDIGDAAASIAHDRVGLLFCQDLRSAAEAIRRAAGSSLEDLLRRARSLDRADINLAADREPELLGTDSIDPNHFRIVADMDDETFAACRVLALEQFVATGGFRDCFESLGHSDSVPCRGREKGGDDQRAASPTPLELAIARWDEDTRSAAPPVVEVDEAALDDARRSFLVHAALWITKDDPGGADRVRAALVEEVDPERVAQAIEQLASAGGESSIETLRAFAAFLAPLEADARRAILRELLGIVVAGDSMTPSRRAALLVLAHSLGLSDADLETLIAEHVDPQFADYPFQVGQSIEVLLDGDWHAAVVQAACDSGDLEVLLPGEDAPLRLNPTADLLRPTAGAA